MWVVIAASIPKSNPLNAADSVKNIIDAKIVAQSVATVSILVFFGRAYTP